MEHAIAPCDALRGSVRNAGLRRAPFAKSCAIVCLLELPAGKTARIIATPQACSKHIVRIDIDRPTHAGESALAMRLDEFVERASRRARSAREQQRSGSENAARVVRAARDGSEDFDRAGCGNRRPVASDTLSCVPRRRRRPSISPLRAAAAGPPPRVVRVRSRKSFVAVFDERLEQRIVRVVRLNPDFAGTFGAARAAGHLNDQLCGVFRRAKIRTRKTGVGVDHADQRDARKVVALRQHLRADEHRGFAARDQFEVRCHRARAARACRGRCAAPERSGSARAIPCSLRCVPTPTRAQRRIAAVRTARRQRRRETAVVAAQSRWRLMQRQPAFAAWTARAPSAARAHIGRRIAAAVDEQQHLIAVRQMRRDRVAQRRADAVVELQAADVDQFDRRRLAPRRVAPSGADAG